MIYKDLQLNTTFDTNPGVTTIIQNAGLAHIPGVEVELTAEPIDNWTIEGSVGYLGFKYKSLGKADPAVLIAAGQAAAAARIAVHHLPVAPCSGMDAEWRHDLQNPARRRRRVTGAARRLELSDARLFRGQQQPPGQPGALCAVQCTHHVD